MPPREQAIAAQRADNWSKAFELWQNIRMLFSSDAQAHIRRGHALLRNNRVDDARTVFQSAAVRWPDLPGPLTGLARTAQANDDWSEALTLWQEVCGRFPYDVDARISFCLALARLNRVEEAKQCLHDAATHWPGLSEPLKGLASIAQDEWDWPDVLKQWQNIRMRFPDDANAHVRTGLELLRNNRVDDARTVFQSAAVRWPDLPGPLKGLARVSQAEQNWAGALVRWREVCRRFPLDAEAHTQLGISHLQLGDIAAAEVEFRKGVRKSRKKEKLIKLVRLFERKAASVETPDSATARNMLVYYWPRLFDDILQTFPIRAGVRAEIGESWNDVLSKIPDDIGVVLPHIDLTDESRVPLNRGELTRQLGERAVLCLNATVQTIAKSHIQETCRSAGMPSSKAEGSGPPEELLIVKSNRNAIGLGESFVTSPEARKYLGLGAQAKKDTRFGNDKLTGYKIVKRAEIAPDLFDDPNLFIEKYISNRRGFFARAILCRDKIALIVVRDHAPIKTIIYGEKNRKCYLASRAILRNAILRNSWFEYRLLSMSYDVLWRISRLGAKIKLDLPLANIPRLLRQIDQFCLDFGLDYGHLDIAGSDMGDFYIIDVNKTPVTNYCVRWPAIGRHLRQGLN